MREIDSIRDLERQANNLKCMMDRLNRAYIGLTVEELLRLRIETKETVDEEADLV